MKFKVKTKKTYQIEKKFASTPMVCSKCNFFVLFENMYVLRNGPIRKCYCEDCIKTEAVDLLLNQ